MVPATKKTLLCNSKLHISFIFKCPRSFDSFSFSIWLLIVFIKNSSKKKNNNVRRFLPISSSNEPHHVKRSSNSWVDTCMSIFFWYGNYSLFWEPDSGDILLVYHQRGVICHMTQAIRDLFVWQSSTCFFLVWNAIRFSSIWSSGWPLLTPALHLTCVL